MMMAPEGPGIHSSQVCAGNQIIVCEPPVPLSPFIVKCGMAAALALSSAMDSVFCFVLLN